MNVVLAVDAMVADRGRRRILHGVSLAVRAGEIVGLLGPNGCGKTTLLEALVGRLQPVTGTVTLADRPLEPSEGLSRRARLGLGYLPQGPGVFRDLRVWENLAVVPGAASDAVAEMLARIGLSARRDDLGKTLSGGERRRLEVGRLLLLPNLKVLLCDEPFAGLDPLGIDALSGLLRETAAGGVGVLITDHRVTSLFAICDRMALLLDGKISVEGTPRDLRRDRDVRERYLGTLSEGDWPLIR